MSAVHDGTANINIRNVYNVKCVNCMYCIGTMDDYFICNVTGTLELIEECIANDDNLGCDCYVEDCYDDIAER